MTLASPQRYRDKVVVITGASSGIGRACAERFLAEGASVFGLARRAERFAEIGIDGARCVSSASGRSMFSSTPPESSKAAASSTRTPVKRPGTR